MRDPGGLGPIWIFGLVPLVLVGSWLYQRHREKVCRAWAAATGWTYVGSDQSLVHRWRGKPFHLGHSRRASEVVRGTYRGRAATSFTYRYTTGSGKNRHTVSHHVVALALPAALPTVQLTHDGVGARIAKAFGGQDIRFESEAFNERWRVESSDAKAAHDLVHPRLMERLLAPDAQGVDLRVEGASVLCWASGGQDLDQVARYLGVLTAVVEHVPRFVWLDHGYDPART